MHSYPASRTTAPGSASTAPRTRPIAPPAVQRRIDATGGRTDARLFTGPRGGRITTAVLRDATHWDEVVTELGYEHLRRHDLRHTGLNWMVVRRVASDATGRSIRRIA